MSMTDQVKTIREVAVKNGITLNKRFTDSYLGAHAMFEGPGALAERIVAGMWDMCRHGINNGFDGTVRSCMDSLSDIVVALSELDEGQVGKLTKYTTKADLILQKEFEERKSAVNVAEPVYECVNSCLRAIDSLTELRKSGKGFMNIDGAQFERLEQSRGILNAITSTLDGAFDTTSKSAQQNADEMIKLLKAWRNDVVRLVVTSASIANLGKAAGIAEEWAKLSVGVTRRDRAKEKHAWSESDELSVISESRNALEMLDTFMQRMDSEKADIAAAKARLAERDREKIVRRDELNGRLTELETLKNKILDEIANGADVKLCNRRIKEIKATMDEIYFELGKLDEKGMPDFLSAEIENRESIHAALSRITDILGGSKNDLAFLAETVRDVDFNALIDMLGGRISKSGLADALKSINYVCAGISEKLDTMERAREVLKTETKIIGEVLGVRTQDRDKVIEKMRAERNAFDEELDDEVLAALKNRKAASEKNAVSTDRERQTTHTPDDNETH